MSIQLLAFGLRSMRSIRLLGRMSVQFWLMIFQAGGAGVGLVGDRPALRHLLEAGPQRVLPFVVDQDVVDARFRLQTDWSSLSPLTWSLSRRRLFAKFGGEHLPIVSAGTGSIMLSWAQSIGWTLISPVTWRPPDIDRRLRFADHRHEQRHRAAETLRREGPHQPGVVLEGVHDGFVVMLLERRQPFAPQDIQQVHDRIDRHLP